MYNAKNIVWIKNVKRNQGNDWAYEEVDCKKPFLLNWPSTKGGSARTPNVGDIIVLFQKPNDIDGRKNNPVHLTHLVSPISEKVIEDLNNPNHKWCREVQLIAKANPISAIPNPGYFNFFKPNRGLTNPIINLENDRGWDQAQTQEDLWRLFSDHLCIKSDEDLRITPEALEDFGVAEGDRIIKEHIQLELSRRDASIVQKLKEQTLKKHGKLQCECCSFDFLEFYGPIGANFIECHHKNHIADGERITKAEDLALVCSNCHRMLHRKLEDGSYNSTDSLKEIIQSQNPLDSY
ncbi:HNH endonuclease [Croceimicrobium sp.]|uniref:HNH endonuclease n=1 Tax=Croceimicrobium sp. TaxID=2828340 RepID=UPI003BABC1DA